MKEMHIFVPHPEQGRYQLRFAGFQVIIVRGAELCIRSCTQIKITTRDIQWALGEQPNELSQAQQKHEVKVGIPIRLGIQP